MNERAVIRHRIAGGFIEIPIKLGCDEETKRTIEEAIATTAIDFLINLNSLKTVSRFNFVIMNIIEARRLEKPSPLV